MRERGTKGRRYGGGGERTQTKWGMVVELIHTGFREGELAEETAWHAVVMIPKGGGYYCVIGRVEVMWKSVAVIINCRFTASITYRKSLHRFWVGRSMGTATLEFKLLQQVAAVRELVLHVIFLDLNKSYDALYRSRFLDILGEYDIGPRALRLLQMYWERLHILEQAVGCYGEPFHGERGVTQDDPLSPTIFNVVVDAVVRHWESLVPERWGGAA